VGRDIHFAPNPCRGKGWSEYGEAVSAPSPDATPAPDAEPVRWGRSLAIVVVSAILLTLIVHETVLTVFVVKGASMEPTLREGQRVLVLRRATGASRGDLVVFRNPNRPEEVLIKRVLAGPLQRVAFRRGRLFVDGDPVHEPYVKPGTLANEGRAELEVPEGAYYLLGDNRAESVDSRRLGPVPFERVVGRVVRRF